MTADKATPASSAHREVAIAREALEDAFENNAPEVHSYLNLESGDVVRIVDGVADPATAGRIATDAQYMRVEPVSSREQYRWMERFIATVEEPDLRQKLVVAIDGKGAFRRFKDVLMSFPVDRERWFAFRSERLRTAIEAWLDAHAIRAVERKEWVVPTAEQVKESVEIKERVVAPARKTRVASAESARQRLHELVDLLPIRELDLAAELMELLRERRPLPRTRARSQKAPEDDADKDGDAD